MKRLYVISGILILSMITSAIWLIHAKQTKKTTYTLAVVKDTPADSRSGQFKNVKQINNYIDVESMLNAVSNNDADLALTDYLSVRSTMKSEEYSDLRFIDTFIERENVVAVFHGEDHALRQAINEGLRKIIANGTYSWISRKYFGVDLVSKLNLHSRQSQEVKKADDSWLRIKQSGEIRMAFSGQVQPFSYYDEDHVLTGFDVEIAESVCKELGVKFTPIVYAQDEIIEGLENRYFDCFWNSSAHIDAKNQVVCFSHPYYISELRLIVKTGSKIKEPGSLN